MRNRRIILFLISVVAACLLPAVVFGQPETNTPQGDTGVKQIARQLQDSSKDPFDYSSDAARKKAVSEAKNNYPKQFDLRDVDGTSYVTPVKFQNPFGTCWGFAAIAAAESSILGSGLAEQDNYDADTLDLSEKHLVYFVSQAIKNPADPQYGEGTHAEENVTIPDLLNGGGFPFMATSLFASGIGPNLENRDPLLKYIGANGGIQWQRVKDKTVKYCYSDDDDWSLPEEWRFRQSYVLKESFMLPAPANVDEETGEYTYNEAGTDAIKKMLLEKRAVQIGFCADASSPSQETGDGKYISKNWAHYTYNAQEYANHAVTIIGWNDDYDKSNFVKGHEPPENGAWLVKNSWGSEEREFPDRGPGWGIEENGIHTGYFWLSYYDKTLSTPEALAFERSNANHHYNIDEHDFMPVEEMSSAAIPKEARMANVFRADECEYLNQVSCVTACPGTRVVSEVYLLRDGFTSPTDGVLVDRAEGSFEFGGFHALPLTSPDIIQKGQYYSVVQTQTTPEGDCVINMPLTMGKEFMQEIYDSKTWVEGVINPRESYIYADGRWYDYSEDKTKETIYGKTYALFAFDNFPIKGYCTPKDDIRLTVRGSGQLDQGGEAIFAVGYKAGKDVEIAEEPSIRWELAGDAADSFELAPVPDRPDRVKVRAKDYGTALLSVTGEGIGTTVMRISVKKRSIYTVSVYGDHVYNGKAQKPRVEVEDDREEVIPSSSYTLSYENNVKCGTGTVKIKIHEDDPKYEGEDSADFEIIPTRAVIRKLTPGKKKLTVTVKNQKASGAKYYQVKYRVKGTAKWKKKTFKTKKNKLVLKKLKKGKRYQVKVTTLNKNGFGGKTSKRKTSGKIR